MFHLILKLITQFIFIASVVPTLVFSKPYTIEKVVAIVEDDMISLSSLQTYRRWLRSSLSNPHILFELRSKKSLLRNKKRLLRHLIDQQIIVNSIPTGKEAPFQFPSGKELIEPFLKEKKLSLKRLKSQLRTMGISLDQFKLWLQNDYASNQWVQIDVIEHLQVSDQDINDYYFAKHKKHFFKKYKYEFNQWRFPLNEEGKRQLQKIYNTRNKNEKINPTLRSLSENQMSVDLKEIITPLAPGQFSKPKCFHGSCYVFELINKSFHNTSPVQTEKLRTVVLKERIKNKLKQWMNEKRKSAAIQVYL